MLAITLTIQPKHYRENIDKQYDLVKNELLMAPFYLSLVTEITKNGNLHFHGLVKEFIIANRKRGTFRQFIHNFFRKSKVIGFVNLTEVTDQRGWYEYCFKDYNKTKEDLDFAPIVILNDVPDFPHGLEIIQLTESEQLQNIDIDTVTLDIDI